MRLYSRVVVERAKVRKLWAGDATKQADRELSRADYGVDLHEKPTPGPGNRAGNPPHDELSQCLSDLHQS